MKELSKELQHQGQELPQLEKQTAALLAELDLEADWICCRQEEGNRLTVELYFSQEELPPLIKLTRHLSAGLERSLQAAEPVEFQNRRWIRFFSLPPVEVDIGW